MQTSGMSCSSCKVKIEGDFNETLFDRLAPEDQEFLEQYLLAGFSIKRLEDTTDLGYAAIRSKLDRLISHYEELAEMEAQKSDILAKLSFGEIGVKEAKEMLKTLRRE